MNIEVFCSSESEGMEKMREIRKANASLMIHKMSATLLCSSIWVVANNAVRSQENSCKSDHRILPGGQKENFWPYKGLTMHRGWLAWAFFHFKWEILLGDTQSFQWKKHSQEYETCQICLRWLLDLFARRTRPCCSMQMEAKHWCIPTLLTNNITSTTIVGKQVFAHGRNNIARVWQEQKDWWASSIYLYWQM